MSAQVIDLLKRNDDAARALRRAAHVYHTTPVRTGRRPKTRCTSRRCVTRCAWCVRRLWRATMTKRNDAEGTPYLEGPLHRSTIAISFVVFALTLLLCLVLS